MSQRQPYPGSSAPSRPNPNANPSRSLALPIDHRVEGFIPTSMMWFSADKSNKAETLKSASFDVVVESGSPVVEAVQFS